MVKKSLLWIYRISLWLISILILVVLGIVLTVQLFLFPNVDLYKDKIAAFASQTSNQKVIIGHIKADWQGINPHLSLANIDIFDAENRPALQLTNIDVLISWFSLGKLEPHLAELKIHAPELTIRRIASGEIFVAGTSMSGTSKPDLPNWLLRQTKLSVLDAKVIWLDEMRNAPSLSLDHLNLEVSSPPWRNLINNHQFKLNAQPSIGTINPISFSGSVYGNDISQLNQWHGNITVKLKNAELSAFKPWFDYPINLQSGTGSSEISVNFAKRALQSVESDIALDNIQLQLKVGTDPILLKRLSGTFGWKNTDSSQIFSADHLTLTTNTGLDLQQVQASYTKNRNADQSLNLKLPKLKLSTTKPYWSLLPVSADLLAILTNLSPTGELNNLTLAWQGNQTTTKSYLLESKFNGLGINAYEKIPGFINVTGEIKANQNSGTLTLYTQNAILDFKNTLRWPVPADKLNGEITWNTRDQITDIDINQLNISNPHLSGTIKAKYVMDGIKGGQVDLKGYFSKGDAKFAKLYYPIMLGETTLHWLDTSILAGRAENIDVTVKGRLADFPFVDHKNNLDPKLGLFKVKAKLTDSLLEYGTGWPTIDGLGLDLLFEGKRMELNSFAGHILGNQLIKSKTTITQLDADNPILNIVSELKGPIDEGVKFVNQSPVVDVTQGFTKDLKTSGQGKLNLSLKIPMQNLEAAQYKGLYQIVNGSLANENIPTLSQVSGLLEFTESSLTAKNIKANAFGAPLTLSLSSGKDKVIRINAQGKLNDEAIKKNLGKGSDFISGSTNWTGKILIQKPRVTIDIQTDLYGITSTLPAPMYKAANDRLNLHVIKVQEANAETININVKNKLTANIIRSLNDGQLQVESAAVHFSPILQKLNPTDLITPITLPNAKGIQLTGELDYLDVDAWRHALTDFQSNNQQSGALGLNKIELKISKLDIFNRRINQLIFSNKPSNDNVKFNLQSREISGDLQWINQNNGKLIARLTKLMIPDLAPNRPGPSRENASKDFIKLKQDYPALDITAEHFEFNQKDIGALEVLAYPKRDDWVLQKLKFSTAEGSISAEGQWNNWTTNPKTNLNIIWDIKDLGDTLKRFGYADTIKAGVGELTGQLSWPGSPRDFDTTRLNGNLQFEVRKGQILKVQPGVGRLLGLLSLQSLPRRLTLDFRDLFSNGFAFDKITAAVKIDKGIMRSDNFLMTGPAADVKIKGETNLEKETQHLFVRVLPNISDSLSLAALAGGPLAGAVAFLAQKVLKDPLNKIVSSEYEIIGTWDNPQELKATISNQETTKSSPLN